MEELRPLKEGHKGKLNIDFNGAKYKEILQKALSISCHIVFLKEYTLETSQKNFCTKMLTQKRVTSPGRRLYIKKNIWIWGGKGKQISPKYTGDLMLYNFSKRAFYVNLSGKKFAKICWHTEELRPLKENHIGK